MDRKTAEIRDFQKLRLLIIRNFYYHWGHREALVFSIFAPLVFGCVILVARMMTDVTFVPISAYDSIRLDIVWQNLLKKLQERRRVMEENVFLFKPNVLVPELEIAWAPNKHEAFAQIMDLTKSSLKGVELVTYSSCSELTSVFSERSFLAGVCFDEASFYAEEEDPYHWLIDGKYPSLLNFTMFFPSELRFYEHSHIGADWETKFMFAGWKNVEHRVSAGGDRGYISYISEGFISIQKAISESYLNLIREDKVLPQVELRRFPYVEHYYDHLLENLFISIAMVSVFSYFYEVCWLTSQIVLEKENGARALLRTMGCAPWIYNLSWILSELVVLALNNLVFIMLLKVSANKSSSILTKSSFFALFVLLFFYNLAIINFVLVLASLMSSTRNASFITPLVWLSTFIPNLVMINKSDQEIISIIFVCFFTNSTMSMSWSGVLFFEMFGGGFKFSSYFDSVTIDQPVAVYLCCIIFLTQASVFFSLAMLANDLRPGMYGRTQKWRPSFRTENWRRAMNRVKTAVSATFAFRTNVDPDDENSEIIKKRLVAMTINLSKKFEGSDKSALHNVSLSLFTQEITVLMGHNGSGKTTLLNIMAGLLQPTKGSVMVENYNVHNISKNVVARIGISVEDNTLFPELTLSEQIYFHGRMKGLSENEANSAVQHYCNWLELGDYRYIQTSSLQAGIRNLLSICCALAGRNSLVLIDELGNGLDMYRRVLLWDLLLNEKKKDRAIFLSTNSFETLNDLADRIFIISKGRIKCNGAADHLNKLYGYGYHLMCVKSENCHSKYVTQFVQNFIPNITPISEIGKKITYIITPNYYNRIVPLVDKLEMYLDDIYLESIAIDSKTFEDVYLSMLSENSGDSSALGFHRILNGQSAYVEENENPQFLMPYERYVGCRLWLLQLSALLLKRFIQTKRSKFILISKVLLPPFLCLILFYIVSQNPNETTENTLNFTLNEYETSLTISSSRASNTLKQMPLEYAQLIIASGIEHTALTTQPQKLDDDILEKQHENLKSANKQLLIAANIAEDIVTCYFNPYPLHAAPLALNMVFSAMARALVDNTGILVNFQPMPFEIQDRYPSEHMSLTVNYVLTLTITTVNTIVWTLMVFVLIRERGSRFKLMQFIAGARINTFWLGTFIVDFLVVLMTSSLVLMVLRIFCNKNVCDSESLKWYWITMVMHGICIMGINYLFSHLFVSPIFGFIAIMLFHSYCIALFFINYDLFFDHSIEKHMHENMNFLFCFLPAYNFADMIWTIYANGELRQVCKNEIVEMISVYYEECKAEPNCCIKPELLSYETGIMWNILICIAAIFLTWIIHILIECAIIWRPKWLVRAPPLDNKESAYSAHRRAHGDEPPSLDIHDVLCENVRVQTIRPREAKKKALLCQYLGKIHRNKFSINRLNFIVEHYQCFGILGSNNSGKSVLMRMLSGELAYSFGRIYVDGYPMHLQPNRIFDLIGYSPQVGGILEYYTPCEIMDIYARLYGIPGQTRKKINESLARLLGFDGSYHLWLSKCSSGVKRRLNTAIAFLGHKSLLYLDEPSACLDPFGVRQLYNIISRVCRLGTAVVMTTYSALECEELCHRLAILMDGRFWSVGSTLELQDKFGVGYMLRLRMGRRARSHSIEMENTTGQATYRTYLHVITFIESVFPGTVLKAQRCNVLYFFLSLKPNKIANIFEVVSSNLENYHIVEFSLSRCTLGTIYLEQLEKHTNYVSRTEV